MATTPVTKEGLREASQSRGSQRHNYRTGLGIPLHPCWDIDTIKYFYRVPVHQCLQHGEQTGGAGDLCAVTGL